ncbi:MAG: LPS-assembly protein LptD [Bacteriovoracia bacterium]
MQNNKMECFGNVYIRRPKELLTADYAILDLNTDQLHAEGNVVYFTPDTVIYGSKMDFNFMTDTGVIRDGRVESDKYQLLGETIERISEKHFKAIDGEYTTCRDCPASWTLAGREVDLTVDGYAFMNSVYIKINDTSTLYLPYAIIPVKTRRQSGFLFPKWELVSPNGFTLMVPYFWAISRSADATIGLGYLSLRGLKAQTEFRYFLTPRSHGEFKGNYVQDKTFEHNRYGVNYGHNWVLPWRVEQKLNWLDASDRDYVRNFPGDIPGRGEPALMSEASLSRAGRNISFFVDAKRIKNLLTPGVTGFDPDTVQLLPAVSIATSDHRFGKKFPLHWGIRASYYRFWRVAPSFDEIYPADFVAPYKPFFYPGYTPLRRAQRFSVTPELYYTARIAENWEMIPSVQYRSFFYTFDKGVASNTQRGYLIAQNEVATTVERVYGDSVKHKIRPSVVYSNIPLIQENKSHPFIQQLGRSGSQFDDFDIVPITHDSLYFVPLGNSLTFRLNNKFITKEGEPGSPMSYQKSVEVTSGQSVDFIGFRKKPKQPLSRFFTTAIMNTKKVVGMGEYFYYPYSKSSTYNIGVTYLFHRYVHRLTVFERSLGLNYSYNQVTTHSHSVGATLNFSINDMWATLLGATYAFPSTLNNNESPGKMLDVRAGISFQSPSQCYKLVLLASKRVDVARPTVTFNVPINLTGEGFTDFSGGAAGAAQLMPQPN